MPRKEKSDQAQAVSVQADYKSASNSPHFIELEAATLVIESSFGLVSDNAGLILGQEEESAFMTLINVAAEDYDNRAMTAEIIFAIDLVEHANGQAMDLENDEPISRAEQCPIQIMLNWAYENMSDSKFIEVCK